MPERSIVVKRVPLELKVKWQKIVPRGYESKFARILIKKFLEDFERRGNVVLLEMLRLAEEED